MMDELRSILLDDDWIDGHAHKIAILKKIPPFWSLFEEKLTECFCAYTPPVRSEDLPDSEDLQYAVGGFYEIDYSAEDNLFFMQLTLSPHYDVHNPKPGDTVSSWIYNSSRIQKEHLSGIYILLKHAYGVMNGTREGQIASNPALISYQNLCLKPLLKADIEALESYMTLNSIAVPILADPIIPSASSHTGLMSSPKPEMF